MSKFKRPISIRLIAACYVLSPIFNLISAVVIFGVPASTAMHQTADVFGPTGVALGLLSPVVGVGLFRGRRWGFVLFLLHSCILLLNNGIMLAEGAHFRAASTLIGLDVVIMGAIIFLMRKDLRAPYLSESERGWRAARRVECDIPATMTLGDQSIECRIINVSSIGVRLRCPTDGLSSEQAIQVSTSIGDQTLSMHAKIIGVADESIGLAVLDADRSKCQSLYDQIRK